MIPHLAASPAAIEKELGEAMAAALADDELVLNSLVVDGWHIGWGWDGHYTATSPDDREYLIRIDVTLAEVPHV